MSVHQYICGSSHLDGRSESVSSKTVRQRLLSPVALNTRMFECKYRPYSCTRTLNHNTMSRKHRPSFCWTLQFCGLALILRHCSLWTSILKGFQNDYHHHHHHHHLVWIEIWKYLLCQTVCDLAGRRSVLGWQTLPPAVKRSTFIIRRVGEHHLTEDAENEADANAQFSFNEAERCWRITCWGKCRAETPEITKPQLDKRETHTTQSLRSERDIHVR